MGIKVKKAEIEAFLRAHPHIEDPHLFDVGQNIGEWRITAFIGKGGSGEVYSAKHSDLGFVAAIKILSRDDRVAKDRFQREAQVFAENPMPVFPRFFGYGQINGRPYMVIELLEHLPLPSADRAVAQYLLKVCVGVGRLHSLGLVHRDIKPQNILQRGTTGEPVLIDLGLIKDVTLPVAHRGESLSIVNGKAVGVGTPRYAAPEQFAGGEISPAADIHALGMLANDCFGGNPPLPWARIIRRSTSSIPSQRYGSVAQFAKAIRHRHWVNLLIVVIGAVIALGAFAVYNFSPATKFNSDFHRQSLAKELGTLETNAIRGVTSSGTGVIVKAALTHQEVRANLNTNAPPRISYGIRAKRKMPKETPGLRPGVRFVPDSDSGGESSSKTEKIRKSDVFDVEKEGDHST